MKTGLDIRLNFHIRSVDAAGKTLQEHRGHNIWLSNGCTWLGRLLAYNTAGMGVPPALPPDVEPAMAGAPSYVRATSVPVVSTAHLNMPWLPYWIGLGVGGNQQSGPMPADVGAAYPGTNNQSDADVAVTGLERAVRIRVDGLDPTVHARWLMPVLVTLPGATPYHYVQFDASFGVLDINNAFRMFVFPVPDEAQYPSVPISEACLYAWDPDAGGLLSNPAPTPAYITTNALAYETFPPIFKTPAVAILATWQILW